MFTPKSQHPHTASTWSQLTSADKILIPIPILILIILTPSLPLCFFQLRQCRRGLVWRRQRGGCHIYGLQLPGVELPRQTAAASVQHFFWSWTRRAMGGVFFITLNCVHWYGWFGVSRLGCINDGHSLIVPRLTTSSLLTTLPPRNVWAFKVIMLIWSGGLWPGVHV